MPNFPSLSEQARVPDLLARIPESGRLFVLLAQDAMRKEDSELAAVDRELLATYVSRVNGCDYCTKAHAHVALALGADEALVGEIRRGATTRLARPGLKALLELARAGTLEPGSVTEAEIGAARNAGWREQSILEALMVIGVFNLINRLVSAAGLSLTEDEARTEGKALAEHGYLAALRMIEKAEPNDATSTSSS